MLAWPQMAKRAGGEPGVLLADLDKREWIAHNPDNPMSRLLTVQSIRGIQLIPRIATTFREACTPCTASCEPNNGASVSDAPEIPDHATESPSDFKRVAGDVIRRRGTGAK